MDIFSQITVGDIMCSQGDGICRIMVQQTAVKLKNFHETNMTFTDVESYKVEAMKGRDKRGNGCGCPLKDKIIIWKMDGMSSLLN